MRTHRPRTAIEVAIDKATGFSGPRDMPIYVTLRCPKCGRKQQTPALECDPEGTTEVVADCPKCFKEEE